MTEKTDLNVSPYYDDFSEDKNFQKVLFRAGRALQSRELTQSQSILQNQVERFGGHIFKEGSIVEGAQMGLDLELYYVKVKSANPNAGGDANAETYRTASAGKYYQGKSTGVVGKVITSAAETTTDKLTLFVKYATQGTDTANSFTFSANEELQQVTLDSTGTPVIVSSDLNEYTVNTKTTADNPNGLASISNISEGIVFIRGFFIKVPKQELILEKYSGAPSYRIGLTVAESIVSSTTDTSLLDNSQGTSNENSTGADRLKFLLTLSKYALTTTDDTDFVELSRVNKGVIELSVNRPIYSTIENTMARRTFDQSGDFVLNQFTHSLREHLDDTTNRGFYTAANGGAEGKIVMQVSPGKAYVKGYEIEKIGTTSVSLNKARTTTSLDNANTPIRIGNILRIKNAHSLPEFGNESGSDALAPFKECELFDTAITTQGTKPTGSTLQIGFARVRNIDLYSGTDASNVYTDASVWNMYMFDIKMFTKLTGTTSSTFTVGDRVVGSSSGATGIVASTVTTGGTHIMVHDVVGVFTTSDTIASQGTTAGAISSVLTAVKTYSVNRSRSITQTPADASAEIFTADIKADKDNTLTGTVSINASGNITGFGSKFVAELEVGDIIIDGAGTEQTISSITSGTVAQTTATSGVGVLSNANCTRRRVKLYKQDQTVALASWPRDWVATHTGESVQIRRQKVVTVASAAITLDTGSSGTFGAVTTDNFTIAVVESTWHTSNFPNAKKNGDILNITDYADGDDITSSGTGQSINIAGFHADNNGAKLKVTYTLTVTDPVNRDKTLRQGRVLQVSKSRQDASPPFYGTAYNDKDITLGVADAFKIRGIYEGTGNTTPLPPSATFTVSSGTFVNYEKIVGQTSGAHGILITTLGAGNGTTYFYYVSGTFVNTELVVGQTSTAVAQLSVVSAGGSDITSRYFFDNGQRDGFYDLAKLQLKTGAPAPSNKIVIVFDYFTPSGGGDFFDVNSYASIPYKDIPTYSPTKTDLGGLEPDGTYELSDAIDFRSVVGQVIGTTTFGTQNVAPATPVDLSNASSGASSAPFGYTTGRSFSTTGANSVDTPVSGSSFVGDITFYVGRYDKVFLHKSGGFQVSEGTPALSPTKPKAVDETIELFEVYVPPYTLNLKHVRVRSQDHRRFTMRDISRINNRVTNLERITSLTLLERDTQSKQVLDGDGYERFKSGFLVDNFRGHKVGDVNHTDYEGAIDVKAGALRPQSYSQFFDIELNAAGSSSYKKTGDLITLPYTESTFISVDKASRTLNVNPYNVFSFMGTLELTPGTDIWQDTTQLPEVRINREGNFDAIKSGVANSLGTVWNSWQTTWVGEPVTVSEEVQSTSSGSWSGDPAQGGVWIAGEEITREITETVETQTRTGVKTSVVEDFVETRSDRIVSIVLIPFCRERTIEVLGQNLKPNTNHYFYFDNIDVNKFVRPFSADYSQDGGTTVTSGLKTDGRGRCHGYFELPNTDAQRFPTGMRELRATSSFYNLSNPASAATEIYQAQGLLQSSQTEIVTTRNGRVVYEQLSGERQITSKGEVINTTAVDENAPPIPVDQVPPVVVVDVVTDPPPETSPVTFEEPDMWIPWREDREMRGWRDPLAQSFMVDKTGGMFVTSIDVYFETKDPSLDVSMEIRTMNNGYPANMVLPFASVSKSPADVNISADGATATTFTFKSPVHLEDTSEYCFVLMSNSDKYKTFISRMGEKDLATGQTIAGQPYAGSLFLSQNNTTWTAEQTDDLKFNMKIAQFDTTKTATIKFDNGALPTQTLQKNPIQTFSGQSYVKVYSYTHGMYTTLGNTTIANVTGDKTGAVLTIATPSVSGTPTEGTYTNVATTTAGITDTVTVDIVVNSSNVITSALISKTGTGYATTDTLAVATFGGATATIAVDTIGETLGGMPIAAINASVFALSNVALDHFCITPDISAYDFISGYTADDSTVGGGSTVTSTRDYYFDTLHTLIPSIQLQGTKISAHVNTTAATSPEGIVSGTQYTKRATNTSITLNDNAWMGVPCIVASPENESLEMLGVKSFSATLQFQSVNSNISPVIDVGTIGCLGIANRINKIDSSSDVVAGTTYVASTEPNGDNNAMTYMTRKVSLKTPAQGLSVIADFFRPPTTNLKVLYKVLENDNSTPFDDIGWTYFNTTGVPDTATEEDGRNYKEYEFTVNDLPDFSAFAIKIVGQGTSTSIVPMVSALRCIALA